MAQSARANWFAKRFIDCFRYSFLLIEAVYGEGQFKKKALLDAFMASERLVAIIEHQIATWSPPSPQQNSPTDTFLMSGPSASAVLDHIIERRGHYFHGNLKKQQNWSQHSQDEAKSLAWLSIQISQAIAQEAASHLFDPEFATRHFEQAGQVGAHVVMRIEYRYRMPGEDFIRQHTANFRMPGTKATTPMAMETAKNAIEHFTKQIPVGRLHSVAGFDEGEQEVFSVRIHTEIDGKVVER